MDSQEEGLRTKHGTCVLQQQRLQAQRGSAPRFADLPHLCAVLFSDCSYACIAFFWMSVSGLLQHELDKLTTLWNAQRISDADFELYRQRAIDSCLKPDPPPEVTTVCLGRVHCTVNEDSIRRVFSNAGAIARIEMLSSKRCVQLCTVHVASGVATPGVRRAFFFSEQKVLLHRPQPLILEVFSANLC